MQDTTRGAIERPREDFYCKTQLVPLWREQAAKQKSCYYTERTWEEFYCKTQLLPLWTEQWGCAVLQNRSCATYYTHIDQGRSFIVRHNSCHFGENKGVVLYCKTEVVLLHRDNKGRYCIARQNSCRCRENDERCCNIRLRMHSNDSCRSTLTEQ